MRAIRAGCCPPAASGHATAPPTSPINSRRLRWFAISTNSTSTQRCRASPVNRRKDGVCYTSRMAKKTTLNEIGEMLAHVVKHRATKDQIIALHTQVIETDIRDMKRQKLVTRVADLEEEVFGAA